MMAQLSSTESQCIAMKLLIVLSVLAAASARPEYHDDVFHFSTLDGLRSLSSLSSAAGAGAGSSFGKSVLSSQPVVTNKYTVQKISRPVLTQIETHHFAQPVHTQVETHHIAQPVHTQVETHHLVQPVQQFEAHHFAQPVLSVESHNIASAPGQLQIRQFQQSPSFSSSSSGFSSSQNFIRILKQSQEVDPLGPYRYSYQTENGISVNEQAASKPDGQDILLAKEGSFSYTGPDSQVYTITYTADENGFQPQGDHLPTPPPIPAEIQRALEIIASQPQQDQDDQK